MQVDTNVDEADIGRIQEGQSATFTVDSFPGQTFAGRVVQIRKSPKTIQNVVTYNVVVAAENPDRKLMPGMTASLKVVVETRADVLRVPNAALRVRPPGEESPDPAPPGQLVPGPPGGGKRGRGRRDPRAAGARAHADRRINSSGSSPSSSRPASASAAWPGPPRRSGAPPPSRSARRPVRRSAPC